MSTQSTPDTFWGNIFSQFRKGEQVTRIDILARIPIFQDLRKRELRVIADITYERAYEPGEFMFETGQPGASMFIIEDGEVQIERSTDSGEALVLAVLKNGEFLGELALLDSSPRSASAKVLKPTKALAIFREDLNKLLEKAPEIGGKVMKQLAITIGWRLKATNELLAKAEE